MSHTFRLDLKNVPNELLLILELLKCGPRSLSSIQNEKPERFEHIDWDYFIDLTMHHRVYPILHSKLKMIPEVVPAHVTSFISHHYKRNTFQMLQLSGEMEKVSQLFSNHQVSTLFLKGPALAHDLYGDISLRTSRDLDILIPIDRIEKAEELLISEGYEKDDYIQSVLNDWKWRHHHVTFFHPQKQIKLEIHWRFNPGPSKEPAYQALWERKRKSKLTSTPVYMLSKEDLFLFLTSHGARHGWSRLRWLLDVERLLLEQELDWKMLRENIARFRYQRVSAQSIILTTQLLGTRLPEEVISTAGERYAKALAQQAVFYFERMIHLHAASVPAFVSHYHKRHLFALRSFREKCVFLGSFLYPYPEDAQTFPLPKGFHFLYFPLRPFLWGWRKTRKQALP